MSDDENEEFTTASERAYRVIREKILCGELEPGARLSQRKMAALSGVSIIPVIEALLRLEHDGLIEQRPQWGARVTMLTEERIRDLCLFREAIECQVARVLAPMLDEAGHEELRQMATHLDDVAQNEGVGLNYWALDCAFHARMADLTNCRMFSDAMRRINLFGILKQVAAAKPGVPGVLPKDWHTRIVKGLRTGDPAKAEDAMRFHVQNAFARDMAHT